MKKILFIIALFSFTCIAQVEQPKKLRVELTKSEWDFVVQTILNSNISMKDGVPIIQTITLQLQAQSPDTTKVNPKK